MMGVLNCAQLRSIAINIRGFIREQGSIAINIRGFIREQG